MSPHPQYPTDLTDKQWQRILPLLPARKWHPGGPGRPPCDRRQVINGIIYVTKTGCQWAMMPPTFGRWKTVYGYFNTWSRQGHWQLILEVVTRSDRVRQGRKPQPSAAVWTVKVSRPQHTVKQKDMMVARTSTDASDMCWWIRWD